MPEVCRLCCQALPAKQPERAEVKKPCRLCGRDLSWRRRTAIFCSDYCRNKAWYVAHPKQRVVYHSPEKLSVGARQGSVGIGTFQPSNGGVA